MNNQGTPTTEPTPHTVTWQIGGDQGWATPIFACSAPEGAWCRMTCPEGCDEWDSDHDSFYDHALVDLGCCNAVESLEAVDGEYAYAGVDDFEARPGPIIVEWNNSSWVWRYAAASPVAPTEPTPDEAALLRLYDAVRNGWTDPEDDLGFAIGSVLLDGQRVIVFWNASGSGWEFYDGMAVPDAPLDTFRLHGTRLTGSPVAPTRGATWPKVESGACTHCGASIVERFLAPLGGKVCRTCAQGNAEVADPLAEAARAVVEAWNWHEDDLPRMAEAMNALTAALGGSQ